MPRGTRRAIWRVGAVLLAGAFGDVAGLAADGPENVPASRRPAYQRHRTRTRGEEANGIHDRGSVHPRRPLGQTHRAARSFSNQGPSNREVASGTWFQRPYPYHLDYYRMRYGGTYEPYYSGGLYGTPQFVVPPGYGYGYGGYGNGGGQPFGYPPPGAMSPGYSMPAYPPSNVID